MMQYRLSFYIKKQISIGISLTDYSFEIDIVFLKICIATTKEAYGIRFFKD